MKTTKAQDLEIKRIAESSNISTDEVRKVIRSMYEFIHHVITDLSLKKDLTEEEFKKETKNFNIPSIGKMYSSYVIYKRINKIK